MGMAVDSRLKAATTIASQDSHLGESTPSLMSLASLLPPYQLPRKSPASSQHIQFAFTDDRSSKKKRTLFTRRTRVDSGLYLDKLAFSLKSRRRYHAVAKFWPAPVQPSRRISELDSVQGNKTIKQNQPVLASSAQGPSSPSASSNSQEAMADYLAAEEPRDGNGAKDHIMPSKGSPWQHLIAGAAAGTVSRSATAPLETLRLQAITGTASSKNLLVAARSIVQRNGWRALYRGNLLNVVRAAPQKALDFFSFEIYKGLLGARTTSNILPTFAAAGFAGATSTIALHPLEVLRSRLTCDTTGQYKGLISATRQIVKAEGVGSLYRGLGPSFLAILPEAAVTYGMYDGLKRLYKKHTKQDDVGLAPSIACGVASSFTGQMLAFPLENIARRLQIEKSAVAKLGSLAFVSGILKNQGPLSLYRGVGAAILKVIPMATISFTTYEVVCLWLTKAESDRAALAQSNRAVQS